MTSLTSRLHILVHYFISDWYVFSFDHVNHNLAFLHSPEVFSCPLPNEWFEFSSRLEELIEHREQCIRVIVIKLFLFDDGLVVRSSAFSVLDLLSLPFFDRGEDGCFTLERGYIFVVFNKVIFLFVLVGLLICFTCIQMSYVGFLPEQDLELLEEES